MIYEVELSNGMGDHVELIVEANCEVEAKRQALLHTFEKLTPYERGCALNGDCPDMVKVHLLTPLGTSGVLKVSAFDHEQGGYCL